VSRNKKRIKWVCGVYDPEAFAPERVALDDPDARLEAVLS
jgi:hypothetical protein